MLVKHVPLKMARVIPSERRPCSGCACGAAARALGAQECEHEAQHEQQQRPEEVDGPHLLETVVAAVAPLRGGVGSGGAAARGGTAL